LGAPFAVQIEASRAGDGVHVRLADGAGHVDSWSIDAGYLGVFRGAWHAHRTRKELEIPLEAHIEHARSPAVLAFSAAGECVVRPLAAK
jgi:hypothetical protein